jgi:hypothetical protein
VRTPDRAKRATHFEQIPIALVKKLLRQRAPERATRGTGHHNRQSEKPAVKSEARFHRVADVPKVIGGVPVDVYRRRGRRHFSSSDGRRLYLVKRPLAL